MGSEKRSGVHRSGARRVGSVKPSQPKARPCPICSKLFAPARMGQKVCSPRCAAKQVKQEKALERAKIRTRKEAIKTLPVLKAEAQREFNAFIRLRDRLAGYACISSGRPLDWSGNGVDAGHYRSVGAAPHLRFNERNCHAQSKKDNQWLAGNAVDYRIGLIARIGLAAVEALEADNRVKKWTRDELIEIRDIYRAKVRALKRLMEQ
ncbi:ninG protein [Corticibacter populi]|uniref:NinG protein n=1 Tax=Corticibacter populi TaxID=1550736 RepID=A0A3M6QZY0_9BURK|nr:recombination protein NinG [Corticibacter populi]RMX08511.1 ninG protein [Corticibacter populi]